MGFTSSLLFNLSTDQLSTYFFTGGSITATALPLRAAFVPLASSITGGNCLTISFTNKVSSHHFFLIFCKTHERVLFVFFIFAHFFITNRLVGTARESEACGVAIKTYRASLMGIERGTPSSEMRSSWHDIAFDLVAELFRFH